MSFHRGQKIEFVGRPRTFAEIIYAARHPIPGPYLTRGKIYTVANFVPDDTGGGVELVEVETFEDNYWSRLYDARCFRAVIERKTDISIFTEMLKTKELVGSGDDRVQDSNGGGCA
jgi:hypothetical protein